MTTMTPMRFPSIFCLCLVSLLTSSVHADEPKPIEPKEKIEFFNGKDTDGWVSHLKDDTEARKVWSVKEGLLLCTGKPNGYLRTEKSYANYKVTVEWRFTKAANTGVLVHINGKDKVWPLCVECQGMHAAQGDMYFWSGAKAKELTKGVKVAARPRCGKASR